MREGKSISPLSVFTFRPTFILFIYLFIDFHTQLYFNWGVRSSSTVHRNGRRKPQVRSSVEDEGGKFGAKLSGVFLLRRCRDDWRKEQVEKIE